MRDMTGTVAFVTGGSSGMGLGTARKLVKLGCRVVIAARSEDKLLAAQKDTGADDVFVMDITDYADWERAREFIAEKYGRLDFLINNAGGGVAIVPYLEQSMENIRRSIDLNLYGAMYGCRVFAPMMVEQKSGLIVNVLSVCAQHAWPGFSVYSAAKAGLREFTKCLYLELQSKGVRATCFVPGGCNTNFAAAAGQSNDDDMKFNGEDVGEAIAALCSFNEYVFTEEMTVWSIEQEVVPL